MELQELAQKLHDQKAKIDDLKMKLKQEQSVFSGFEQEMLEELTHIGVSRLDMPDVGTFYIHTRKFYKIEDKDALFEYIQDQGEEDIFTVQHQTLNAYVKEKIEQAQEKGNEEFLVPGTAFHSTNSVRIRKLSN